MFGRHEDDSGQLASLSNIGMSGRKLGEQSIASIQHDVSSTELAIGALCFRPNGWRKDEFVAWIEEDTRAECIDGDIAAMAKASWFLVQLAP